MSLYDLLVLGSGPAGQRAAIQAAKIGKRVLVVERRLVLGGVSVNTGTIPSKTFREAVLYLSGFRERHFYGQAYTLKATIGMSDLLSRCAMVMQCEQQVVADQLHRNGVELVYGEASFEGPHALRVTSLSGGPEQSHEGDFVVIAVGTAPTEPRGTATDHRTILLSDDILHLERLPHSLCVVGGGVIGIEYASMFAVLGVKVTVVEKRTRILEFVDPEIVDSLVYQLRDLNVTFRLGEEVDTIESSQAPERAVVRLKSGKVITADTALFSVGRQGNTATLRLANAGLVADDRGRIPVDGHFRTRVPHIFAVGDVIGFPALASTSLEQGRMAALAAFGLPANPSPPELLPYGIYSIPELSVVGENEETLTAKSVPYETGTARYREIARGQILGDDSGMLKLLFHRETRKLLGVGVIGTGATELVHIGQAVLAFGGSIDYFVDTVFNYPTLAECYKTAALAAQNKLLV